MRSFQENSDPESAAATPKGRKDLDGAMDDTEVEEEEAKRSWRQSDLSIMIPKAGGVVPSLPIGSVAAKEPFEEMRAAEAARRERESLTERLHRANPWMEKMVTLTPCLSPCLSLYLF